MSSPTDAEIAALLALPTEAREALKKCEGPGWRVDRLFGVDLFRSPEWATLGGPFVAWLPANPLEIVRVAAERLSPHYDHHSLAEYPTKHEACVLVSRATGRCALGRGPTPHLAALALLAEVWR